MDETSFLNRGVGAEAGLSAEESAEMEDQLRVLSYLVRGGFCG